MAKSHERAVELLAERTSLSPRHRRWLYAALASISATGALWICAHYALAASEFGGRNPVEAWALKLHGAAAFFFLIALGSMFAQHIPRGWFLQRNIASGVAVLSTCAILVATGYALYYFALDDAHAVVGIIHWALGIAAIALGWIHPWLGRNQR